MTSLRAHFHPPGLASSPTGSAVVFDEYLRVLTVLTVPPEPVRCRREVSALRRGPARFRLGFRLGFWVGIQVQRFNLGSH